MYRYTEFDRQFVQARAAQYRDQLERWQSGQLTEEEFKPLGELDGTSGKLFELAAMIESQCAQRSGVVAPGGRAVQVSEFCVVLRLARRVPHRLARRVYPAG